MTWREKTRIRRFQPIQSLSRTLLVEDLKLEFDEAYTAKVKECSSDGQRLERDKAELKKMRREIRELRGAVETVLSRKRGGSESVKGLELELSQTETKLAMLQSMDPDEGDDDICNLTSSIKMIWEES